MLRRGISILYARTALFTPGAGRPVTPLALYTSDAGSGEGRPSKKTGRAGNKGGKRGMAGKGKEHNLNPPIVDDTLYGRKPRNAEERALLTTVDRGVNHAPGFDWWYPRDDPKKADELDRMEMEDKITKQTRTYWQRRHRFAMHSGPPEADVEAAEREIKRWEELTKHGDDKEHAFVDEDIPVGFEKLSKEDTSKYHALMRRLGRDPEGPSIEEIASAEVKEEDLEDLTLDEVVHKAAQVVKKKGLLPFDYQVSYPSKADMFPADIHLPPDFDLSPKYKPNQYHEESIVNMTFQKLLRIGSHTKIVKGGRINSYSALVLVGDEKGTAAMGYGKGAEVQDAVGKAMRDARKHLVHFDLVGDTHRTVSHQIKTKFRRSFVMLQPRSPGFGLRVHGLLRDVAEAIGITDLSAKTHGSRVEHNMIRAIFKAFAKSRCPERKARMLGLKKYDYCKIWRYNNVLKQY